MSEPGNRLVIGPFNRVEGDLEVRLETSAETVVRAEVSSPLYRGFERMLVGKGVPDALVYAPRICGICSVSQSVAAAYALAGLAPGRVPPAGRHAVNLIHAVENLADHFTHFHLFFMPDFARPIYADEAWYPQVAERFTAIRGSATRDALPARAAWMEIMGVLAGKWPHTLSIQPGGSTRAISRAEKVRVLALVRGFRRYLETTLLGDALEAVAALDSGDALHAWSQGRKGDFAQFLAISRALGLSALGRTRGAHMSFGAYQDRAGGHLCARGTWVAGAAQPLETGAIAEDVSHAWYAEAGGKPQGPLRDAPAPDLRNQEAYSWCKAPRLGGQVVEVGALSRQLVAGHPLLSDLALRGANVEARVVARMVELARVVPAMERWIAAIDPDEPFIDPAALLPDGEGAGLTEAARGSLGHWLRAREGRIEHYQIIAPTTWNFSPRDARGVPGPLEQALEGTPIRAGETEPVAVQHVVRSFDPCMVCTVH
ncbi:nickel-dependent hydrogenase large subunit [Novosphingobium sp. 1949]|uniref:Nickel-dependent hydrogenase large subunit n=1 Tax=Novosphingobium organovorum TaxID=2930092 RepID=A0ABT0BCN4_9SPHN|nr:nickel-dependent hydrogenase large subunit [Novosphingobium organovorum]MCJ2182816.1 nickel-dependent hydrogenase large subunit [Novosphingobium organovorum]